MMRPFLLCLLVAAHPAGAAGVYKSVGPDGVEYTDRPVAGSQPLTEVGVAVEARKASPDDETSPEAAAASPGIGPYTAFEIALPEPNATVRNDTGDVQVSLILEPALQAEHRIRLLIDNQPISGIVPSTQVLLKEVNLGTHTLQAQIIDGQSTPVAATQTVTFHMRKPVPESALP